MTWQTHLQEKDYTLFLLINLSFNINADRKQIKTFRHFHIFTIQKVNHLLLFVKWILLSATYKSLKPYLGATRGWVSFQGKKGNSILTKCAIFNINNMHTNNTKLREKALIFSRICNKRYIRIQIQSSGALNTLLVLFPHLICSESCLNMEILNRLNKKGNVPFQARFFFSYTKTTFRR